MSKRRLAVLSKQIEQVLNANLTGSGSPRTIYVIVPGRGVHRRKATRRAKQVLAYIAKHSKATSADLQKALDVNRNVISGAVFELRKLGLIKSEAVE